MTTAVLIVAAGRGRRLGDPLPKQYLPVGGISSLRRCLDRFLGLDVIDRVQVVFHPDDQSLYDAALGGLSDPRLSAPVPGGETRAASVLQGLLALGEAGTVPRKVLVHDAARPFVSHRIITEVIAALENSPAAFAALPVVDALWRVSDGAADVPVPRDGLWRAQTPQGFHFDALLAAHRAHGGDAADDVEIARAAGLTARVVPGEEENFKITSPGDLARAEALVLQGW